MPIETDTSMANAKERCASPVAAAFAACMRMQPTVAPAASQLRTDRTMSTTTRLIRIAALAVLAACASCSTLTNTCGAAMPTIVAGHSTLADVQRALSEVDRLNIRETIAVQSNRARFDDAMAKAWAAYEVAVRTLALAADACATPSIATALSDISDAWTVIRQFVSLFGGREAGGFRISDPVVWTGVPQ